MKHTPRKRFGQHFLIDAGMLDAIVAAIRPQAGERIIEIGPGLGALTRPLLAHLPHLDVVELDRDLAARLRREFAPERLTVHEADALRFDFGALGSSLRIVGNLPYNISSPLLFHLATFAPSIRDLHFMLQKEVVMRLVAEPGQADYGRLTVMLARHFERVWLFDVPPEAFDPPPKVDSAVVRLVPRAPETKPALDEAWFAEIVATAFAQRRKTLRNTLGRLFSAEALAAQGIDPGLRAEALSLADFERLASALRTA